jgi:hypothetical protein
VGAGVLWSGTYSIGDATAALRSNAPGATPPPFTLFSTKSTVDSAAGVLVRGGFAVTPSITLEASASLSRPALSTQIFQDAEQAAAAVAGESLEQYVCEAGAVWYLPVRLGPKWRVFASGGGGYLRQLHQERTLVETGSVYYAGAGVNLWLRGGHGPSKSLGIRSDARINWRRGGIEFENQTRAFPTLSVALFVGL